MSIFTCLHTSLSGKKEEKMLASTAATTAAAAAAAAAAPAVLLCCSLLCCSLRAILFVSTQFLNERKVLFYDSKTKSIRDSRDHTNVCVNKGRSGTRLPTWSLLLPVTAVMYFNILRTRVFSYAKCVTQTPMLAA